MCVHSDIGRLDMRALRYWMTRCVCTLTPDDSMCVQALFIAGLNRNAHVILQGTVDVSVTYPTLASSIFREESLASEAWSRRYPLSPLHFM